MSTAISPQHQPLTLGALTPDPIARETADVSLGHTSAPVTLQFRNLSKRYPARAGSTPVDAVSEINLAVQQGEVLCLMGTSGSGKSTLLRHINRLIEPSQGSVLFEGEDVGQLDSNALRQLRSQRIGMVFQHFGLLPHRNVRDNVALPLELRNVPESVRHAAAEAQLLAVGLAGWGDHFPGELSGGMQQRLGLARALVSEPRLLLMDEPFSALDPTIRRDLQSHFLQLVKARGITTLLVTHDPAEALRLGDRIAVMRGGRLIQVATPEQILAAPADAQVADFFRDEIAAPTFAHAHIASAGPLANDTHCAGLNAADSLTAIFNSAQTAAGSRLSGWQALLLGPAAFDRTQRSGVFWGLLTAEFAALAALGQGTLHAQWAFIVAAVALLVGSRVIAQVYGPRLERSGTPTLALVVQWVSQGWVLWRSFSATGEGPLLQFPARRDLMLAAANAIDQGIGWLQSTFDSSFVGVIVVVRTVIDSIEGVLGWLPWPVAAITLVFLAWRSAGTALALTSAAAVAYIGLFGFWSRTLSTLALVGSSVLIVLIIGVPAGILVAKRPWARRVITPVLDVMQTLPTFVYLIPAVAFFSVGKTPAVIATVIFALAPMIRLTALGIHEVPENTVEAAVAHGASPWQTLTKVELPLASGSLLLGINQTIVMSLSMVVVAALIGAGGLGYDVMTALRNIKGGEGMLAGAAIVFCALIPDRIIQSALRKRDRSVTPL